MKRTITPIGEICSAKGNRLLNMWRVDLSAGSRTFQLHSHSQFEVSTVYAGSGTYSVGGVRHEMKAGDYFVFCSNEAHFITDVGNEGLSFINLQFEPDYLFGRESNSLTENALGMLFSHGRGFCNRIAAEKAAYIHPHFTAITNELTAQNSEYRLCVKSHVNLMLISLIRQYDFLNEGMRFSRKHAETIHQALDYIHENYCEPLTLQTVAEQVSLSPNYFSSLFHQTTKMRFQDYVNAKRIERAIDYMTDPTQKYSVLQIALLCGFNNTANFNKAFKKLTGITPSEFRK